MALMIRALTGFHPIRARYASGENIMTTPPSISARGQFLNLFSYMELFMIVFLNKQNNVESLEIVSTSEEWVLIWGLH